ncbi:MAG: M20 family metallopeptidase [Herpetosiphon sp.]|nr:M20 family metallopeptidase [Herpetosiphon sp.]
MPKALRAYLEQQLPAFVEELERWIEIESFSRDVMAVSWMIDVVGERLAGLGADVHRLHGEPQANHLLGYWDGTGAPIVIVGHVDTVYPAGTLDDFPFRVEGDIVRGPGVSDMKGCILLTCYALQALRATGRWTQRPLLFLVTSDEELGSPTSRPYIEHFARNARAALIIESAEEGGWLKTWRKSVSLYELHIAGKSSHAGVAPELGISAIHELAHQIEQILPLANPSIGTTINIGKISGGTATNVVAAEALCSIDVRALKVGEAERVDHALRQLTPQHEGARLALMGGINRPAMEQTLGNMELYYAAEAIANELDLPIKASGTGGGSDGNFTSALGTPTLDGLGGWGSDSHSTDEWLSLAQFAPRAAMLARLIETL